MLLDSESEQNQSCPGAEHLSEGIGYRHNHLEKEILKDNNEINRGESHGFTPSEQIPDPACLGGKEGPVACSDVDDSINDVKISGRSKTAPYYFSPPHLEKGGKEPERYMVKAVKQIELPKMIVCYKEGPYDITKDIRIDERTRSFDKLLVENGSEDKKGYDISQIVRDDCMNELYVSAPLTSSRLIGLPISDVKKDKKHWFSGNLLTYDTLDGTVFNEDDEKRVNKRVPSPQDSDLQQFEGSTIDIHSENLKNCSLASLLEEDRVKSDISGEIVHAYETKDLSIAQEFRQCCVAWSSSGTNLNQPHLFKNDTDQPQSTNGDCEQSQPIKVTQSQCVRCDCIKLVSAVGNTDQLHYVCDSSNEEQVHKTFYHCALEQSNSATSAANSEGPKEQTSSKDFPVTDKSGSNTMAFDFDSELPATKPKKEIEGVPDFQLSGLATCGAALDNASTEGPGALPQISPNYAGRSVSNLRGPASLSARISFVDQIPYSGSMSLRSDSSAISGRSFAFPILQSEWNSSPVRMAKADRRHPRGHRSWIPRRFCCRF